MKAIVTGAGGFVGSALVRKLLSENIETLCIDLKIDTNRVPESSLVKKIEMSIDDIQTLPERIIDEQYDLFYHFAWAGSAGPLRMDEKVQVKNALWTVDCLRVAKMLGCTKFICAGSIMEYEANEAIYAQESRPGLPYIYGIGKVLAHELCKPIANSIGIDLVWAYITNAYGVGEKSPRFINTTLRKIINGDALEFTAATQNYDFIYIDDVAEAFYLLGQKGKANKGYMIGSGNARPLRQFIMEMLQANYPSARPVFGNVPFTGVNLDLKCFNTSEMEKDCGFKPTISFAEGTARTMKWLREVD